MNNLDNLPSLRDIIRDHDLRAEKKLGQNFLLDQNLTDKIARVAGDVSDVTVFEVGPGPGGLTRSLLHANAKKVIAVEYDPRAIKALESLKDVAQGRLDIHHTDALKTNLLDLSEDPTGRHAIVANLPYNIATPLLIGWLKQIYMNSCAYQSMTLMFQKEVAQRITAQVGDKAYGRLAILSQWLCYTEMVFNVPASAFSPPPKVTSSIVHLTPKKITGDQPDFQMLEKLTAAAFGQRRKMVRSSLNAYSEHFEACGIDPTWRAENLQICHFVDLAKRVIL